MNRRKFVFASTVSMLVITITVAGLAFFSNFAAKAFVKDLPSAIRYLPADSQAVFGMNVQKFISSPIYAKIMEKHGAEIGTDLADFIAKTGVDPRQDLQYIIAAGRQTVKKDAGVVIAVGNFKPAMIIDFINSKGTPIKVDYKGASVLMIPEASGTRLEKGIAFLSDSEIALGDLDSLHAVLDVRAGDLPSIDSNASLSTLMAKLDPADMFWFAGNASSVLSKAPANTPFGPALSTIQAAYGAVNLTTTDLVTTINAKITVTASDEAAAAKLSQFVNGLLALGSLASGQNPELASLIQGVKVTQASNQFDLSVSVPFDLLQKLEETKSRIVK